MAADAETYETANTVEMSWSASRLASVPDDQIALNARLACGGGRNYPADVLRSTLEVALR